MSGRRFLQAVGLGGILLFFASAFTPLPNLLSRWTATPPAPGPADAIVVLGGGVSPDGALSRASLRRVIQGIVLHRKGLAPLLVVLGPSRGDGPVEAEVRATLARELGVPATAVVIEDRAWTTREEAARVRALLQPTGARRILLVTDSRHMARARPLFEQAGFEVRPSPADDLSAAADTPEDRVELFERVLKEFLARIYYRVAGYL